MRNLEEILHDINKDINIDKDRQKYASNFVYLRDTIFNRLRGKEPFGSLFNGFQLGGSYGDNLKVTKPNEYDLVFHIRFPDNNLILVREDHDLPGNVHIDLTKVMEKIRKEKQNELIYKHLLRWINKQNYLIINKIQSYFYSCFTKVMQELNQSIKIDEQVFKLRYTRAGPAHTVEVNGPMNFNYAVDFVPGLLLEEKQSLLPGVGQWEAIPKPLPSRMDDYTSFRASYYREEHKIISNKHSLKNTLRMLKKFRDSRQNMLKMKSYFIKTLFLWKAKKENNTNYWRNSLSLIIIDMFKEMEKSFDQRMLPFFWNSRLNLYEAYSFNVLTEMFKCVQSARLTLEKANVDLTIALEKRVYRIFLTTQESLRIQENGEISVIPPQATDMINVENNNSCRIL
uniref:Mab-21 domain-containing protein n=1 Tax=Glossina brevipalpis TaxID=37001 RepID=A0A1A9WI76_9MUSC